MIIHRGAVHVNRLFFVLLPQGPRYAHGFPLRGGRGVKGCQRPLWRRIFSITTPWGGSMKAITFIWPPQLGQAEASTS